MNKREWLKEQGIDVGERGRFSAEHLKLLKDYVPDPEPGTWMLLDEIKQKFPVRFITGGTAWDVCFQCGYSVEYCIDGWPVAPPWLEGDTIEIWTNK